MPALDTTDSAILDVAGVGAGPSNLSLAALMHRTPTLTARFFDRQPRLRWHPGLLLPGSALQVSCLKDLVTLVDPTNPHSFLAFLADHRRLYRAIIADRMRVPRREFEAYLQWVASRLPQVRYNSTVHSITLADPGFRLVLEGGEVTSRHAVIGTGTVRFIPKIASGLLGESLLHAADFQTVRPVVAGRRVAVIGGGQTGAELVEQMLAPEQPEQRPMELTWISRRANLLPIDDSPFANEWFVPAYARHFAGLPWDRRQQLIRDQTLASDGISAQQLASLYHRLYDLTHLDNHPNPCRIGLEQDVVAITRRGEGWCLDVRHQPTGTLRQVDADLVVLATGFRQTLPDCLAPLAGRFERNPDGSPKLRDDFSVVWDGPARHKLFVQNGSRSTIGVADPNLSLLAWRAALILNSIAGQTIYDIETAQSAIDWSQTSLGPVAAAERAVA